MLSNEIYYFGTIIRFYSDENIASSKQTARTQCMNERITVVKNK